MAGEARRIDWPGLMRAGLHGLGLHPREFWALTPVELMVMLGREGGAAGFSRAALEALMARYPDDVEPREEGEAGDRT